MDILNPMSNNENINDSLINLTLLHLLDIIRDDSIAHKIQNLTDSDWDMLILRSAGHKVAPLLYQRLFDGDIGVSVPEHAIQKLRRLYLNSSFTNAQRFAELARILKALSGKNIQAIVLKGFAIGGLVYDNIALRPMNDVDLLVKGEDVPEIDSIFSDLGWTNKSLQLFTKSKKRITGDITFSKDAIFVDLHSKSGLMPKLSPWNDVSFVKIDETDVPILRLDDFMIHLILHLDQHLHAGFSELIRLCDIMEMLKKFGDQLDWNHIEDTAKANKAANGLYRILHLLSETSAKHLLPDIDTSRKYGLFLSVHDMLLIPRQKGNSGAEVGLSTVINSKILPARYKLRKILKFLFPNKSYMVQRYTPKHPYIFFLYYPVRLILGILMFIRR